MKASAGANAESEMFDSNERDLCATLSQMHRTAIERSNFDQNQAKHVMRQYLQADRRFDQFDPDRLIERVQEARSNGRTMDLADDPYLRKGGEKRPLSW